MGKSKTETYRTLAGEDISYPKPTGELAAFFARVRDATNDPNVTENDMIELVYGRENPLLDQTIFKDRGAVTKATFANPLYNVMLDLMGQKRVQEGTLDLEAAGALYTMTVAEAATAKGVHESAIRQAIAGHRLTSWKKKGRHMLDPDEVANYQPSNRGPRGSRAGTGSRVRTPEAGPGGRR